MTDDVQRRTLEQVAVARIVAASAIAGLRDEILDERPDDDDDERDRVARFVAYLIAQDLLAGHVRELVWTEPPFPEGDDQEAKS